MILKRNARAIMSNNELPNHMVESWIAIVLTDIIGSTKFVQRVGSRTAAQWFGIHDRYVMNFIARHNGQLVQASDGPLMYFPTVQDAIAFAFEYKGFIKRKKLPFKSRVGIHWDKMLIVRSEEHMVRAGGKRINLEGLGKNIAARTMSICGEDQILLSHNAYIKFKERTKANRYIPKDAKVALAGLYQFKGVKQPEQIYSLGTEEAHLQPPPSGEKVTRLGGNKKIRVRLRNKKFKEILAWFIYRIGFITFFITIYVLARLGGNFHTNSIIKSQTGINLYYYLGWLSNFIDYIYYVLFELQ